MSTTLLDVSAGSTAGISNGFRVDISGQGPVGLSIRTTTPSGGITEIKQKIRLIVGSSNFTDGPQTAADIKAELAGGGSFSIPIEASTTGDDIRFTEAAAIMTGPIIYGYLEIAEALSDDLDIEIEALPL